MIETDTPLMAI